MAAKDNAITLLKQDHRDVEGLFERFDAASGLKEQRKIATEICDSLRLHARVEEKLFYPAARKAVETGDLLDEAEVEHGSTKRLIEQIESGELSPEQFRANVTVLKEYVEHHVKEEEGELFKQVRASKLDLDALGAKMREMKSQEA